MTRAPAYQTYANDLLASFTGLSLTALGAVHRLHLVMWGQSPDQCSLIDDDAMLARTIGCSLDDWKLLRQEIQHPGRPIFEEKNGQLMSLYLLGERKKQAAWRKKSQHGGKQSGKSRASKAQAQRTVVQGCLDNGSDLVRTNGQPKGNSSLSSPIPSSIKKDSSLSPHAGAAEESLVLIKTGVVGQNGAAQQIEEIIKLWNAIEGVRKVETVIPGEGVHKALSARLKKHPDLDWWKGLFQIVKQSDFLCGRRKGRDGPFHSTLTWVLKGDRATKILQGDHANFKEKRQLYY